MRSETVPFNERGGRLRGVLDVVSGRFPGFVFGGGVGSDTLPVFHFHDERREDLEPKLRYLADNGYKSVTNDEIARFVTGALSTDGRRVGICFDDVWASVWTVAAPLLKKYGFTAIVYAIPGRIEDSRGCRPNTADGDAPPAGPPLATWPELRALHASGVVDVQCHTYSHARIFCASAVTGYVTPSFVETPLLNRPQILEPPNPRFLTPSDLWRTVVRRAIPDVRRVPRDGRRRRSHPMSGSSSQWWRTTVLRKADVAPRARRNRGGRPRVG